MATWNVSGMKPTDTGSSNIGANYVDAGPTNTTSSGGGRGHDSYLAQTLADNRAAAAQPSGNPNGWYGAEGNFYDRGGEVSGPATGTDTTTEPAEPAEPEKTPEEKQQEFEDKVKEELAKRWAEAGETTQSFVDRAQPEEVNIDRVDHISTEELRNMLQEIVDKQKEQTELRTDYTVQQGVNELTRALEDAGLQFQEQRNQISADEAKALDNQALYAEARGDRGGIGEAQYASIQNTAATNRFKTNQAQTKLSTDTARQIADLRAQGEFEKADALLSITQSYLSELKQLEQWALQTNLSVDEFNIAVDEWEKEFNQNAKQFLLNTELSTAQVTGAFSDGTPTLAAREQLREQLAQSGQAFMQLGLTPTPEQIEAMGYNQAQWEEYQEKYPAGVAGGGGGGGYMGGISYLNSMYDPSKEWSSWHDEWVAAQNAQQAPAAASGDDLAKATQDLDTAFGAGMGGQGGR